MGTCKMAGVWWVEIFVFFSKKLIQNLLRATLEKSWAHFFTCRFLCWEGWEATPCCVCNKGKFSIEIAILSKLGSNWAPAHQGAWGGLLRDPWGEQVQSWSPNVLCNCVSSYLTAEETWTFSLGLFWGDFWVLSLPFYKAMHQEIDETAPWRKIWLIPCIYQLTALEQTGAGLWGHRGWRRQGSWWPCPC